MELLLLSLSLALLLVSITIAFPILGLKLRTLRLPPGRLGWPVLGESLELLTGNPEKFISDRMRKYSPDHVFKTKILGQNTVVFCGPDANKFLFSNEQKLFKVFRPPSMEKLFCISQLSSATESMIMKSLQGFLKPHALVQYLGSMDSMAKQHLQECWDGRDQVKASPLAKIFTLTLASRFFLGTDDPGRITKLVASFDAITLGMHSIPLNFPGTIYYRANKVAAAVFQEIQMLIREKKAAMAGGEKPQDILSYLITLTDDPTEQLKSEVELSSQMMGMLAAGYFTVATSITFLMKYVGEKPEIYQKIRSEHLEIAASKKSGELLNWNDIQSMKYSWNVFCEVIRLRQPIQGGLREAVTDFTYAGCTIPKGWKVLACFEKLRQ